MLESFLKNLGEASKDLKDLQKEGAEDTGDKMMNPRDYMDLGAPKNVLLKDMTEEEQKIIRDYMKNRNKTYDFSKKVNSIMSEIL